MNNSDYSVWKQTKNYSKNTEKAVIWVVMTILPEEGLEAICGKNPFKSRHGCLRIGATVLYFDRSVQQHSVTTALIFRSWQWVKANIARCERSK